MTLPLLLEIADTPEARARGLMDRLSLPLGLDGMLFLFDRPQRGRFTNDRTLIPLDVTFLDSRGGIIATVPMRTIAESGTPELYDAPRDYSAAIETLRGYLAHAQVPPHARLQDLLPSGVPGRIVTAFRWL